MDIVLSRIIKYMNGCLTNDYNYRIGSYICKNCAKVQDLTFEEFVEATGCTEEEVLCFCKNMHFDTFSAFHEQWVYDYKLRQDQIKIRLTEDMVNSLYQRLDETLDREEVAELIAKMSALINDSKRIVFMGGLYPLGVSVELQTDLIMLDKEAVQYHHFLKDFKCTHDDLIILMSATGRILTDYVYGEAKQNILKAKMILLTQNKEYIEKQGIKANYIISVPGRFDGIQFNYQIMLIFDLMRICYYQNYYLPNQE